MSQPPPRYGDSLRKQREDAGLSQVELAAEAGVSRGTIQRLEYGHEPSRRVARRISAAFERLAATPDRVSVLEAQVAELRSKVNQFATQGAA